MGMKRFFTPNIQHLQEKGDVQALLSALTYKSDPIIRAEAAKALGAMKVESAVQPLTNALADEELDVRWEAAQSLSLIGQPALNALIQGLDNSDVRIAAICAKALGRIPGPQSPSSLLAAFEHADRYESGHLLGTDFIDARDYFRHTILSALAELHDISTIDFLIGQADGRWEDKYDPLYDEWTRDKVMEALARIGEAAIPKLISTIREHGKTQFQYSSPPPNGVSLGAEYGLNKCVEVLGHLAEKVSPDAKKTILAALCEILSSDDYSVHATKAWRILAYNADETCVAELIKGLCHEDDAIRSCAIAGILHIGKAALPQLQTALSQIPQDKKKLITHVIRRMEARAILRPKIVEGLRTGEIDFSGESPMIDDVKNYLCRQFPDMAEHVTTETRGLLGDLQTQGLVALHRSVIGTEVIWNGENSHPR